MTVNRKWLNVKDAARSITLSAYKTRLCIIVAVLIAFTSFTAFSTSQSKTYNVIDGDNTAQVVTSSVNAADIATASGLKLNQNDVASFDAYADSDTVIVTRRSSLTVSYHGESKQFVVEKDTVENTLSKIGISLCDTDKVSVDLSKQIADGMTIAVDKVETKEKTEKTKISYDEYLTLVKSGNLADKLIAKTKEKITVTRVYDVTYTNGKQTSKELKAQSFNEDDAIKKAEAAKKAAAAKAKAAAAKAKAAKKSSGGVTYNCANAISPLTPSFNLKLDKNGVPTSYKKLITGKGTAYSGGGWTASGRKAGVGYVAVNPKQIPYGTKLFIRSADGKYVYGYAIAADTGGFIHMGRTVDLYFNTESECNTFGVRNVEIYVLS